MISYETEGEEAYNPLLTFCVDAPRKWLLRSGARRSAGQYRVSVYTVEWVSYFAALALHLTSVKHVYGMPSPAGGVVLLTLASICVALAFAPLIEASHYQLTKRRP